METDTNGAGRDWKDIYAVKSGGNGYSPGAMDHFMNPRNAGRIEDPDGVGSYGDPECGDFMELTIRLEGDVIADARFKAQGCPGAISTSSAVTCLARGKNFRDALLITDDDVVDFLGGIPEHKRHCSLLGVHALRAAIQDAVLMKSLIEHGIVASREEYARLRAEAACGQAPGHSCDGSCGAVAEGDR